MPELPEVEVTRRGLAARIEGATVLSTRWGKPLRWPLGIDASRLVGLHVRDLGRRGKYLLLNLNEGLLLLHLGMSGSLRFDAHLPPPLAHDHFDLVTTRGTLRLHDPRRFGAVVYASGLTDPIAEKLLGKLGMEPLSEQFSAEDFVKRVQVLRTPIKQALLGGRVVVGVGNIYACEALFAARIHPLMPSCLVAPERLRALHFEIVRLLEAAVQAGGTTLRDFSDPSGHAGHFQTLTRVYGREGQPCAACGVAIARQVQGQRSTYFCPGCQPG